MLHTTLFLVFDVTDHISNQYRPTQGAVASTGQDWCSRRQYLNTHKPLHHQEEARGTYMVDIMADSIRTMRMNYLPVGVANIGSSKTRE